MLYVDGSDKGCAATPGHGPDPAGAQYNGPMSGFALCFHRTDSAGEPAHAVERMLTAMAHLGPDGQDLWVRGPVALGHLHFRTTPEEQTERQPLAHPHMPLVLAWDGRLDNREEVYRSLAEPPGPLTDLSDAALVLHAYGERGRRCLGQLLGPFALVLYNHHSSEVLLARDPMGGRGLNYYLSARLLIAASEPGGVLAHPALRVLPDHRPVVTFLAIRELVDDATPFTGVKELMPADVLQIGVKRDHHESFWPFDPAARCHYRSNDEYAERFLELLRQSVHCRLRGRGPRAVAVSGGLDSAPIAALAARYESSQGRRCKAASWVFDRFTSCDERRYLDALYRDHALDPVQVNGDAAWALSDFANWPIHPSTPLQNPYRRLHEILYQRLQKEGVQVVLTGMMGDHLYLGTERWLKDLLRDGRLGALWRACVWDVIHNGWRAFIRQGLARGMLPDRWYRRWRPRPEPDWLTPFARRYVSTEAAWPAEARRARRPWQYMRALELRTARAAWIERYFAGRFQLELRQPFRDRRLVEFMLQLPTEQLQFAGVSRPIVRRALRERLPPEILGRSDKTAFQELLRYGLCEQSSTRVRYWMRAEDGLWPVYIDPQWIGRGQGVDGVRGHVHWLCISLEMWSRYTSIGFDFRRAVGEHAQRHTGPA